MFDDEFNGTSLDTSKWHTCYPWFNDATGCTNEGNNELQWYMPSGVSVSNGTLKLTATKQAITGTNGKTYPYTSGMVSSGPSGSQAPHFDYEYGFIETRAKLPAGKGMWPGFWTAPSDTSWPPEVDVFENWGVANQVTGNDHWGVWPNTYQDMSTYTGPDFTAGFHTFGFSWSPTKLVWYIDGVAWKTETDPSAIPAKRMYIMANLAIDGNNPPDGSTVFPATAEYDYIRAWQQ